MFGPESCGVPAGVSPIRQAPERRVAAPVGLVAAETGYRVRYTLASSCSTSWSRPFDKQVALPGSGLVPV